MLSKLPKTVFGKKKRLGRGLGSGKGAKSGRGTTRHQAARQSIPLHFEGGQGRLVKKYPLLRGKGHNKPRSDKPYIIYLSALNVFKDGDIVDLKALVTRGIVKEGTRQVKVLGNGEVQKKIIVRLPVSQAVKKKIEKAGGNVEMT